MPYFFFSYARDDWNPYMKQFYGDLVEEIASRTSVSRKSSWLPR